MADHASFEEGRRYTAADLASYQRRRDAITTIADRLTAGNEAAYCVVTPRFVGLPPLDDGLLIEIDSAALLAGCERNLRTYGKLIAEAEAQLGSAG